ncbi:Malate-2H(+)/Na(+)-lactate antiporter, partial [Dysosmobacter welbionis]
VEGDDCVHPVDELRPQELLERLHGPVGVLLVHGAAEAHGALLGGAAGVGGHDDDGILKVHLAAVGVGDLAVIQDLEKDVQHIGMGLLNLVEEDHGVGLAADLLCQLARLVIPHVARRGAHQTGDGVLLHELRHIQPDQGIRRVEEVCCQLLHQLCLAHAGGPHKDEADRLVLGGDAHPVPPHRGGYGGHGLVLADDMALEPHFQLAQALELLLPDLGRRDFGPQLDNMGQILHGELWIALFQQTVQLCVQLEFLALQLRHAGVVALGLLLLLLQHGALFLIVVQLPLNLHAAGDIRVFQIQVGTGLVDQVDGLVRQEPVGDVPLTEQHRLTQDPLRDLHPVVLLILGGQALENLHRVLNGGLVHRHRLEPPLQSGVLLDGLAVLVEGGGANHLDLAPGEGGFQDVGGVHAALGVAGAHNVVNLVDHQNNVPQALHLVDKALHPALELAPELGAGHQSCQIQQVDLLVPQLEGHVAL